MKNVRAAILALSAAAFGAMAAEAQYTLCYITKARKRIRG